MTSNTHTPDVDTLLATAHAAGLAAVAAATVQPMVVVDGPKNYFVEGGPCGFAWVTVKPANCTVAKMLKAKFGARKAYQGGVAYSIQDFGQSIQRKETYAYAFARVLSDAGVKAYAESRMD